MTLPDIEGPTLGNRTFTSTQTWTSTHLPKSLTLPGAGDLPAETITTAYTPLGNPVATTGLGGYVTNTTYRPFATPTQLLARDGGTADINYYRDTQTLRLNETVLDQTNVSPGLVDDTTYTYDPAGNVTRISTVRGGLTTTTRTTCNRYDALRELAESWTATDNCAAVPTPTVNSQVGGPTPVWQQWSFTHGIRTSQVDKQIPGTGTGDTTTTYAVGVAGHAHATTSANSTGATSTSRSYGYDAAGNRSAATVGGVQQTLSWTATGKLDTVAQGATTLASYVYDANGSQLLRKNPTKGTVTLYLGGQEVTLTASGLTGTRYYRHGGNGRRRADGREHPQDALHRPGRHADGGAGLVDQQGHAPDQHALRHAAHGHGLAGRTRLPRHAGRHDDWSQRHRGPEVRRSAGQLRQHRPGHGGGRPDQPRRLHLREQQPRHLLRPLGRTTRLRRPRCWWRGRRRYERFLHLQPDTRAQEDARRRVEGGGWRRAARPCPAHRHRHHQQGLEKLKEDPWGSAWNFIKSAVSGALHLDEIKGLAEGIMNGDEYQIGYFTGKLVVNIGFDIVTSVIGAKAAQLASKALKGESIAVKTAEDAADGLACGLSFAPETPVVLADGTTRPISELQPGDFVLARDLETGVNTAQVVTRLWINHDDDLLDVSVVDDHGEAGVIHTTENHPFWAPGKSAWVRADQLAPGTEVQGPTGKTLVSRLTPVAGTAFMWDITVSKDHTFFAVASNGSPVLVHNCGTAANTASLESRAAEIHGALDPFAQTRRTTAALGTQEGTTVIGGGVRDLSPAQRALLRDGEMMAGGPGHAEVTTVLGARGAGLTPQEIVTTTNICPACQVFLRNEGATITGPRSARW